MKLIHVLVVLIVVALSGCAGEEKPAPAATAPTFAPEESTLASPEAANLPDSTTSATPTPSPGPETRAPIPHIPLVNPAPKAVSAPPPASPATAPATPEPTPDTNVEPTPGAAPANTTSHGPGNQSHAQQYQNGPCFGPGCEGSPQCITCAPDRNAIRLVYYLTPDDADPVLDLIF